MSLLLTLLLAPASAEARKKKDNKYDKKAVTVEQVSAVEQPMRELPVTDPAMQLSGEWDIVMLARKKVYTLERAYVYLDFAGGNKVYGNNGCNTINGTFTLSGHDLRFSEFITTGKSCNNVTSERTIMKALEDARRYTLTTQYNIHYLNLLNAKGNTVAVLKRHSVDLLNGAWLVKEINSENVSDCNVRVVIDADQQSIHADTGCNIVNGVMTLDPSKDMAVQFEDLRGTDYNCADIAVETALLLALENTASYKRINQNEMALMDNKGRIVVMLYRMQLR